MKAVHRVLVVLVCLVSLGLLFGCSQPGSSSAPPPSNADAQIIATNVMTALGQAMSGVKSLNGAKGLASQATYSGTYSGSGYTVSYTATNPNANGGITATVTITFSGFSYSGITFSSGTATINLATSTNSENFTYTGSFKITYQGTAYDFSWSLTYNLVTSPTYSVTYTGNFTINGQTYTYTG